MIMVRNPDPDLSRFLDGITNHPILSSEEERALIIRAQAGDVDAGRKVCSHNMRFVLKVALRYQKNGLPLPDLVHVGGLGLMRAILKYDPATKYRLISYAVWWIRQAIITALNDTSRTIRIPVEHEASLRRLRRARLSQVIGGGYFEALDGEAIKSGIPPENLISSYNASRNCISMDQPCNEDGSTPADFIIDPSTPVEDVLDVQKNRTFLRCLRDKLDPQQKRVITLMFALDGGEAMNAAQIGAIMGVTRERVRQIKEKGIARMRWWATNGRVYAQRSTGKPRKADPP